MCTLFVQCLGCMVDAQDNLMDYSAANETCTDQWAVCYRDG